MGKNIALISLMLLCLSDLNTPGHDGAGTAPDREQELPGTVIKLSLPDYRVYLKNYPPLDRLYCREGSCSFLVNHNELQQVEASGIEILGRAIAPQGKPQGQDISGPRENGAYHNYNETRLLLRDLETRFPGMAQVITIGYSLEGRELNVLKISDNVGSNENEPNVFIVGCHQAREWISAEIPLLFARYLLENYSLDPRVKRAVNGAQIYIMPIQNPDGLEFSINTYRFWTKNRRNNGDSGWGVDTNRNYNYMWGYDDNGSSPNPTNGEYRGAVPFSEPETQALRQFLSAYPPTGTINFQNYGQAILYPWGYTTAPAPDAAPMNAIAREIAGRISQVNGRIYTCGSLATALYVSNGNITDWIYGTFGTPAFTIELSPEYMEENSIFTSGQKIASAFAENLPGLLYFTNYFIPNLDENGPTPIPPDNKNLLKPTARDSGGELMSMKTIDTDYYRAVVNGDGSLTFTDKNTGALILDSSPLVYFNSKKLSGGNNVKQMSTSKGDKTELTIIDNDNPFATITHCYQFNTHSPYIDYTVTWLYKQNGYASEERFDFNVPGQEAEVLTRDMQLTAFNPGNTYWSDLYTPKVVKFANGLYFAGNDTMESMKVEASDGQTRVSFYSDYSENHPHFHFIKNGGGASVYSNETQRNIDDVSSASIQFAVTAGEPLRCLVKARQPYGYDAVLLFTSHPDTWTIETAKAVAYGSADENSPSFGSKGIVGRGLGWTHGTFKNGQWYSLEYSGTAVKNLIDQMYRDGVEIVPHSITPSADNRTVVEKGLETFSQYNTRNWIDHGAGAGSDNFEDLASQGAIKGDDYYIMDLLAKFNYRYAWSYIDLTTENYSINLLKPGETAAVRPILFYNNRLDDNPKDNKKIFLWSTMNTVKSVDLFYTAANVDALINERGVHIGHEYFGYPTCENHAFYKNNGVIEIFPAFDAQLEYIAKKRADGLVWSPVMAELGDYWTALKDITVSYNTGGTITVANKGTSPVTGITLLAEENIRSVIFNTNDLVSFGDPLGKRELVLPTLAAGSSAVLRVSYGVKDTARFPVIVSNDSGKNKVNEISAYWSNAQKILIMTAAARGGRHSFTVTVPVFAGKTVTVTNVHPGVLVVGNFKASGDGKITFAADLKTVHTFELKATTLISSTLTVTSPNGGENWPAGSMQMIKWTSAGFMGEVKIDYSTDGGGTWNTVTPAAANSGSYFWTVAQAASSQCLIRICGAADGTPSDTSNNPFSIINIPSQILLNHTALHFGAKKSGPQTPPQSLLVTNSGSSVLEWYVTGNAPWLKWTPAAGKNTGDITVSVDTAALLPGTYTGIISVSAPNAVNSPGTVNIGLIVYDSQYTGSPIGSFDTPPPNVSVSGCIAFTGWALDNIGIESVTLYRETEQLPVYIGDAVFAAGARPDVEKVYPGYPLNYRAGWGYMMLTNILPNAGNGIFKIQAVATNKEGRAVTLGVKTIIVNNTGAVKPFGAIDMPEAGGIASGSRYRISGWALTPKPNLIPQNGSTIDVYIDGVYLGHPTYNIYRADIAGLFPDYANSNGAHAYFDIDTTAYSNGVHQIYWVVTDSAGNSEGIGSRFFTIQNTGNMG